MTTNVEGGNASTTRKLIQALFFVLFSIGCSIIAGYIIALVVSATGVIAMGWVAASIAFIYLLHSGLFMKAYNFWMAIASHLGDFVETVQFA